MRKNRSRERIIYDTLKFCLNPERPTWVMYKLRTSTGGARDAIEQMKQMDLLEISQDSRGSEWIKTTKRGYEYLRDYRQMLKYFDPMQNDENFIADTLIWK